MALSILDSLFSDTGAKILQKWSFIKMIHHFMKKALTLNAYTMENGVTILMNLVVQNAKS